MIGWRACRCGDVVNEVEGEVVAMGRKGAITSVSMVKNEDSFLYGGFVNADWRCSP